MLCYFGGFVYWLYLLYEAHWVALIMMTSFQFLMFSFYFREVFGLFAEATKVFIIQRLDERGCQGIIGICVNKG